MRRRGDGLAAIANKHWDVDGASPIGTAQQSYGCICRVNATLFNNTISANNGPRGIQIALFRSHDVS